MVVQHNLQAMNANRMLNVTTGQQAKSTEKLSSGYRINRAADDAAGLTISEKMRKQIKGLDQASTNAQDGVSAVQTAEGALTEVHSMLQRMNELAVQSANGTNAQSDRDAIQAEITQLTTEIDRVSETTKFNEIYLLKGDSKTTKDVTFYKSGYVTNDDMDLFLEGSTTAIDKKDIADAVASGKKLYTEAAKAADMIITTGGVSVGKKDIMHESLRLMGAERIFWRVKMKPGMPTLFSAYKKTSDITATDHCASEREIPIISLSGNPFGVAVSIELLIRPALEKMMQDPSIGLKEVNGIMADNFEKGIKGRRFIRAYLENGKFHLPNGLHSNGVLSSMAGCNCLIDTKTMENQESRSLNAGDKVSAILL